MEVLAQLTVHAILAGAVYSLVASGLSFIYATTRVFHLAHGGVIAFSAYVFWWLSKEVELSIFLSGFIACISAVVIGVLMNELVYEPLRAKKTKGLGYLIATIALLMLTGAIIITIFGAQTHSMNIQTMNFELIGGAHITLLQIFIVVAAVLILTTLGVITKFTKFGKAMRAVADNETVSEVLGINNKKIRRSTFAVGSFLGGVAAIFIALEFNLEPNMGVMMAIKGFTAMVIGGAGSMVGAIFGSSILGGAEQAAVWFFGGSWRNSIAFLLLFLFLLVKPTGIFGRKKF